jgi:hypothetical protein
VNSPIAEGDRLGTTEGRAEVYMGKSNYLRLDQNTKVDFLDMPKKGSDLIRLKAWAGNVYLNVNGLAMEKGIEVHTGDVSVYVLEKGLYRIDVHENEATEVMVFEGVVEAAGEEGSNMINAGQRAVIAGGRFTSRPSRFVAATDDAFGQWNQTRDALVDREIAERHLPGELQDFEGELDQYGRWTSLPDYGNVWVPGGLSAGWRPYYYGRWVWLPMCGWTWMSYDPWGWAPFHYGRWGWNLGLGWYWIPGGLWGPGWVNWWWDDYYYGWAPLSYYGMPIVIIDNFYYDRWNRDYPNNSRALTVIRKDQLRSPDISRVALGPDAMRKIGKIDLKADRMLVPRTIKGSDLTMEKMDGNRVLLRSPGRDAGAREIRRTDTGRTTEADRTAGASGTRKVVERSGKAAAGQGAQGTSSTTTPSSTRKIRKKDGDGNYYPSTSSTPKSGVGQDFSGYPSTRTTTKSTVSLGRSLRFDSPFNKYYNSISRGGSSSSSSSRSVSGSRSSGSSSSGRSASSSSSSSRGSSSSSSRGSSSSSSSGGSRGHKK